MLFYLVITTSVFGVRNFSDCAFSWLLPTCTFLLNSFNLFCFFISAVILTEACRDGWVSFNTSCYLFIDDHLETWPTASQHCAAHRSHLATIETRAEDTFIRNHCQKLFKRGLTPSDTFWVGGTDDVVEGAWLWYDTDTPITFFSWSPGQPQNGSTEDCLCLFGQHGFLWDDALCADKYHFICEQAEDEIEIVG